MIAFRRCSGVGSGGVRLRISWRSRLDTFRNVVASNIVSQGTDRGIRIKSTRGRGGVLENIRFDNWVIEDTPDRWHAYPGPLGAEVEVQVG